MPRVPPSDRGATARRLDHLLHGHARCTARFGVDRVASRRRDVLGHRRPSVRDDRPVRPAVRPVFARGRRRTATGGKRQPIGGADARPARGRGDTTGPGLEGGAVTIDGQAPDRSRAAAPLTAGDDSIAKRYLAEMTLEEKATLLTGDSMWTTAAVPRIGLPALRMADGPHGVRRTPSA